MLDEVILALDEFEAIRLADLLGYYHEQAAVCMNVSRATFGRIIDCARRKTAEAIIMGKALRIEGGPVYADKMRTFQCYTCANEWDGPAGGPADCPHCHKEDARQEQNVRSLSCCRRSRREKLK
jgi:predicted DNA-binding protein (UPF0251 family)